MATIGLFFLLVNESARSIQRISGGGARDDPIRSEGVCCCGRNGDDELIRSGEGNERIRGGVGGGGGSGGNELIRGGSNGDGDESIRGSDMLICINGKQKCITMPASSGSTSITSKL